MNFWEIIFLFFAFQAFLFSVFIAFKKKGDRVANLILSIFLILFSLNLIYNVFYWSRLLFKIDYVGFYGTVVIIWVIYPILIFIYSNRVLTSWKISFKDGIHLIPLILVFWAYYPIITLGAAEKLQIIIDKKVGDYIHFAKYMRWVIISVMVFYTAYTYFSFRNRNVGLNKMRWFKWVIGSFSCYVLAMIIYFIIIQFGVIPQEYDYFITFMNILFIGLITYFGIMQPDVFDGLSIDKIAPIKKYQKTGLSKDHSLEVKSQLINYMNDSKPYLNNELRLRDLANKINLSVHHTSQVINEHFDSSFNDFINNYRIEEAKRLLIHSNELNITDIIFSCGFNNRVSFYKAFKKHTGKTPSSFKSNTVHK